jgi:hypothetical protein
MAHRLFNRWCSGVAAGLLLAVVGGCGQSEQISTANTATAAVAAEPAAAEPLAVSEPAAPSEAELAREGFVVAIDNALAQLAGIDGYTYTLRKQERVDGALLKPQTLDTKIRHEPFSVYLRFTAPADVAGKEAIYVDGQNDGQLIGHGVGLQGLLGTQKLDPRGTIAMMGNRNPITDSGMKNLMTKLRKHFDSGEFDKSYEVRKGEPTEVDQRPCHTYEVHNINRQDSMPMAKSITTFDDEWKLPVRSQRYFWPSPTASEPHLVEDYTYLKVNLEAKLSDKDFDPANPRYDF